MPANESFVGRAAAGAGVDINSTGFKVLRTELQLANKVFGEGLLAGVTELATGGSKVKAVWESIKWSTLARAGLGGFALLTTAAVGLATGIRQIVEESGALQAAMNRLSISNKLQRNFEALLGSATAAKARVSELYAFAASSKFEFEDIAAASRALTVLSNGIKGGLSDLQELGRISAATSIPLQDIAGAVGQASNAIRTGMDFSGPIMQLQQMGVMTEGTVKRLQSMAIQGASTTAIMDAFNDTVRNTSEALGETALEIEDLEKKVGDAKQKMLEAFGAPFLPKHRKEIELTGKVYENLTGAVGKLGELIADIIAPIGSVGTTMKEVAASKPFAAVVEQMGLMLTMMVPLTAGWLAIKGSISLASRGLAEFQRGGLAGLKDVVKGAVSPTARGADWAARAGRIREAGGPEIVAKGADLMSKAWTKAGVGAEFLGSQIAKLAPRLLGLITPMLALTAVSIVATEVWKLYNAEVEKAARLEKVSADIKKDTAAMQERAKNLKTQDEYLQSLTEAQKRYNAALAEEAAIQADTSKDEDERHAAAAKTAIAKKDLRTVEGQDTSKLGAGKDEVIAAQRRAEIEREIRDIIFEAKVARASDGEKAILLAGKRAELEKGAAGYAKSQGIAEEAKKAKTEYESAETADKGEVDVAKARADRLQKEVEDARASEFTGVTSYNEEGKLRGTVKREALEKEYEAASSDLAKLQGPTKEEKKAKYIEVLKKGGQADVLEAQALEEEASLQPDQQKITKLRAQASDAKLIENERAKPQAEALRQQSLDAARKARTTEIAQRYAKQSLGVTSETYQAEDVLARQQQAQNVEQFAEATKGYKPEEANDEAKLAYKQQKAAVDLENAQIQKGIDERARQLSVDKAAFSVSIKARELESEAAKLAAQGKFVEASLQQKAAQDVVDKQHDLARAIELRAQGYSKEQADAMVASEQGIRSKERKDTAEARFGPEGTATRSLKEKQLAVAAKGGGPAGKAAQRELSMMQDADKFKETYQELMQGIEATPENIKKATETAKEMTVADIALEGAGKGKETGAIASSLTAIGGGGGYYAGGGPADNAKEIAARQSEIMGKSRDSLGKIEQAMTKDGILIKGGIK